jgi:hypothetical protein
MKKLLLVLLTTMASLDAFAIVSDRFQCEVSIKDSDSKIESKQKQEFFIARLPVPSITPGEFFTSGSASTKWVLHNGKGLFDANLTFTYKHAIRSDSKGVPQEARQFLCFQPIGFYCDDSSKDCMSQIMACLETPDPFDPVHGWAPTSIVGGVAVFNPQSLTPKTFLLGDDQRKDRGTASVACRYLGTFN